jgi:glutamate/tyrosine decarboxylase-like PLP-dependent enzyme
LNIALTWATLLYNGRLGLLASSELFLWLTLLILGFVEKTQRILDTSRVLIKRLEEVPFLEIVGTPLGPILAITSTDPRIPIHALGNEMNELGWSFAFLQQVIGNILKLQPRKSYYLSPTQFA